MNNGRGKVDLSYSLFLKDSSHSLLGENGGESKYPLVQVKAENKLDNKEAAKKINAADLSVLAEGMEM